MYFIRMKIVHDQNIKHIVKRNVKENQKIDIR
jgi:hypothetical protein